MNWLLWVWGYTGPLFLLVVVLSAVWVWASWPAWKARAARWRQGVINNIADDVAVAVQWRADYERVISELQRLEADTKHYADHNDTGLLVREFQKTHRPQLETVLALMTKCNMENAALVERIVRKEFSGSEVAKIKEVPLWIGAIIESQSDRKRRV